MEAIRRVILRSAVRCFVLGSLAFASPVWAADLAIPKTFVPGTPATAADVNQNFSATATAVNSKQNRVTGTCPAGQWMQGVNADGSVICQAVCAAFGVNIDFGTQNAVPASTYGAAGRAGVWTQAGLGITPLVDRSGAAIATTVEVQSGSGLGFTGVGGTTDDQLLLNDNFFSSGGAQWTVILSGLTQGSYSLWLYAPANSIVSTGAMTIDGGGGVTSDSTGLPGGVSTLILNTSARNYVVGVNSSTLTIKGASATFSGLAGLQIERFCP